MRIVVSACLVGRKCKYDGGDNYDEKLVESLKGHEVIAVCPEVAGGLPTPRIPCELVNGVVMNRDGENKDPEFRRGAARCLREALEGGVEMAILQSRSPSCGVKEIYDGSFTGKRIAGQGVFAKLLSDHGIRIVDVEDWESGLRGR